MHLKILFSEFQGLLRAEAYEVAEPYVTRLLSHISHTMIMWLFMHFSCLSCVYFMEILFISASYFYSQQMYFSITLIWSFRQFMIRGFKFSYITFFQADSFGPYCRTLLKISCVRFFWALLQDPLKDLLWGVILVIKEYQLSSLLDWT